MSRQLTISSLASALALVLLAMASRAPQVDDNVSTTALSAPEHAAALDT